MIMIYMQIIGCGVFAISSIILAILLRKYPSEKVRITTTVILHHIGLFLFMLPIIIGFFYPGITSYDKILGIQALPYRPLLVTIGVLLVPISIFYIFVSCLGIVGLGQGAPGINLTKKMVDELLYKTTRNPMSFGFYAGCLALGFMAGSTYFILLTLFEIIPLHILYLKIFEEFELEMRFGQSYIEYKKRTPFLIPNIAKIVFKKSLNNSG